MRKIISTILVLTMVLSLLAVNVNAAHWAQEALDFVTENGYWIAPEPIEPDKPATRAETASLFARILISKIPEYNGAYKDVSDDNIYGGDITAVSLMGLMVGHEDEFRPEDTLTREELACILDRASKMVSDEFIDTTYNMAYLKDRDEVSDWALQSVMNASAYVLMKGKGQKLFDPQGTTTLAEVATVIKSLADLSDAQKAAAETQFTVRDIGSSDNIQQDFSVIQSGGIILSCGFGGWGMMARLSGGTQNIYLARKHTDSAALDSMAHPPVNAVIIDPDGNVVTYVNMYYKNEGTMEKIVSIPNAKEGIYRVRFTGGSETDVCTIGFQDPISWGILPQDMMLFTSTQTQPDWYFYVPKKFNTLSMGIGGSGAVATIWTKDGNGRVAATAASTGTANSYRKRVDVTTLQPETVYKVTLPTNFRGIFGMQGLSQLLCPTPEMAEDLKGGYIYHTDKYGEWQLEGPLQVKARERMVEIYEEMNGNFDVDMTGMIPDEAPTEGLDNPRAEAMLFGAYFGSIIGMKGNMDKQVLDPSNPWFGNFATYTRQRGEEAFPELDWQHRFVHSGGMRGTRNMVGALTINAETNYWYANPVIQKRLELMWLAWIVQMNAGGMYHYGNPANQGASYYYRTYENFQFGEQGWPHGYYYSRNFLSPQTRAITDSGLRQYGEQIMTHRGQGVSNQMQMGVQGSLYMYLITNDEFFHEYFARCIDGIVYPSSRPGYLGQTSPQGYWQEGKGSDGSSYGRMNEGMWDDMVLHYMTLPEEQQRPDVVKNLTDGTERFLLFDSQFYAPAVNGFASRRTAAFTTRVNSAYGGGSAIIGNAYIQNMFPRAMANHDAQVAGIADPDAFDEGNAGTVASVIMSDSWAYRHLKQYWPKYLSVYNTGKPDSYVSNDSWSMYKALHEKGKWFEYDEIPTLPYALQGNYNIYDVEGGSIAAKHDGLYLFTMYNHDLGNTIGGYAWFTPGPAQFWDEYFGCILASQKPDNYNAISGTGARNSAAGDYRSNWTEQELVHTSVIGKDSGGQLLVEGKGNVWIDWIEEGKSWSLTHTDALSNRNTVWKYFMTDEGWDFEAGFEGEVQPSEDMWVQLPLIDNSRDVEGASFTYDADARTVTWAHEDKKVVLSWEEGVESRLRTKNGEDSVYRQLQLRVTDAKPRVKFSIRRDVGDYVFVRGIRDGK